MKTNSEDVVAVSLKRFEINPNQKEINTFCTNDDFKQNRRSTFELGDIICPKYTLRHNSGHKLMINYNVTNKNSDDPYEKGFRELRIFKNNKIVKVIKLRKDDEPAWHDTPFVRIREKQYFADIDNDGFDEFAIFPYSPGSASFGTLTVCTFKNNISLWGKAKYHIEGDGHALFNCPKCSKFDLNECKKCE